MNDLKLYMINFASFTISFTDVEMWLKILLLVVSIGYTISKWSKLGKDK